MYDVTKLVSQTVFDMLMKLLPTPKQQKRGRKRIAKQSILEWHLQVLVNGIAWRKNCPVWR